MSVYGIDLGTTNSLIGLHETGYLSDLVPSCVDLETGVAGASQYENMKATRSYKVDMSQGVEGTSAKIASQYVLQELKRQPPDGDVKDVVISVPAYFSDNQRAATMEAAKNAGLNVLGLVNEPTAAAMYIASSRKGLFVVFDLGGGTFDCSIIDSRFGTFDVQATDGCKLGGDDFDRTIVRWFLKNGRIPLQTLNREKRLALQHYACKMKVRMQKEHAPFVVSLADWDGVDVEFTPTIYIDLMKSVFAETINCMRRLIRSCIPSTEVYTILLVGGSTRCPFLRQWITKVTGQAPAKLTYDPDRVVAQGAALYASLVQSGEIHFAVSDVTKQLGIGMTDGTVTPIVPANSKVPLSLQKMFANNVLANQLQIELYQGQGTFKKDNECIGTLIYNYSETKEAQEGQVIVKVEIDSSGIIKLSANELLMPPQTITLTRK